MEYIIVEKYGAKRKHSKRICPVCDEVFYRRISDPQIWCSMKCRGIATRKQKKYNCAQCGKEIYRNPAQQKRSKSGYLFCSKTCKNIAQHVGGIKEIQPSHYKDGMGHYREKALYIKGNLCERCGISEWHGGFISMDVHHIDGNRKNNHIDNLLVVCPNCHRQLEMEKWNN